MKSLIVDSFAFAFATIVVLVVLALYLGVPAGMLSMLCSIVSASAAVSALIFLIVLKKTIEPIYAIVEHCGYREAHEAPDIIQYEGASYVKADLDALEKLVGDLSALGDIPDPLATGASCALIAERIKRAIGVWE